MFLSHMKHKLNELRLSLIDKPPHYFLTWDSWPPLATLLLR